MTNFKQISPHEFTGNVFDLIAKDWMLISSAKDGQANTMTASWGGMGFLWNTHVAYIFIRPQRFTKQFVDTSNMFSLSFLGNDYRKQLNYLGTVSGKDENKIEQSKLTLAYDNTIPYFTESKLIMFCNNLYAQALKPECFIDTSKDTQWYPEHDHHTMYIGEIKKILIKE